MTNHITLAAYLAFGMLFLLFSIILIIKSRYETYTTKDYVIFFRQGRVRAMGFGGAYFKLPIIDQVVSIPISTQRIDFIADEKIIFKPKFERVDPKIKIDNVVIEGFILFQVEDGMNFYSVSRTDKLPKSSREVGEHLIAKFKEDVKDTVEGFLSSFILEQPMDDLYTNRSNVTIEILHHLESKVNSHGVNLLDIRIKTISFNEEENP